MNIYQIVCACPEWFAEIKNDYCLRFSPAHCWDLITWVAYISKPCCKNSKKWQKLTWNVPLILNVTDVYSNLWCVKLFVGYAKMTYLIYNNKVVQSVTDRIIQMRINLKRFTTCYVDCAYNLFAHTFLLIKTMKFVHIFIAFIIIQTHLNDVLLL